MWNFLVCGNLVEQVKVTKFQRLLLPSSLLALDRTWYCFTVVYKVHDSPPILNKRRDICIAKGQARGHSVLKIEKIVQNIKCIWKGCGFTKYLKAYIISPPFRSNHKFFWVYFCYLLVWFPKFALFFHSFKPTSLCKVGWKDL